MKLNKYFLLLGMVAATMTLTSCEDRAEEITSIDYNRTFSPLGLEARVMNQINVRLSWSPVAGASTYNISVYESLTQTGEVGDATDNTRFVTVPDGATPVKTFTGITMKQVPYTIESLSGETRYIFEIVAVGEKGPSKGTCVEAKTGTEQTFKTVADADIKATSVTLRWNAADAAGCTITLTPGDIKHVITAEEGTAKAATIEDLTGETKYTAVMTSAVGKVRGTAEFTTAIDLGGAIAVNPGDNLNTVIATAEPGSTLAVFPGTYECLSEDQSQVKIVVDKDISIKAVSPADRPVIKGCFHITEGASLSISQVVLDGTGSDGSQAFEWKTATNYGELTLEDCEIKNYTKGFFYLNVAGVIDNITINNCLIHDITCSGGDMFDSRKGGYNTFKLTNSTIYKSAASRDLFRYDDASSSLTATSDITVDHCTFYKVGNGAANYRLLYVRFKGNKITWTNNIVAEFNNKRGFSEQASTGVPTFANNYYYNTENLVKIAEGNTQAIKFFDEAGKVVTDNPFKDPENGDFTLVNEDMSYYKIGPARWIAE